MAEQASLLTREGTCTLLNKGYWTKEVSMAILVKAEPEIPANPLIKMSIVPPALKKLSLLA